MSIDKEPADVAMEFLVDEPASSSPQTDPAPLPTLKTAQDLLDWVSTYPKLGKAQRSNETSAIRALARVVNAPLAAIPLDEQYLLNVCYKAIRVDKSRKKRRSGNIITLLNRVLKRAGIIKVGSRRSGKITVAWTKLLESLSNREDIFGLSTFARFCSESNIEPHEVTLKVWHDFADETLHHSGSKNPRETLRRVVIASNRSRSKFPHWPLPELPKLVNPRTVSIPKEDLPKSFWDDIKDYMAKSSTPPKNIFDPLATAQLSIDTLMRYSDVAWRTASAQVHEGRDPSEITNLAALLDFEWLKKAMNWSYHHAGAKFLKDHLNTAATWVSMADNYVHPPQHVIQAIRVDIFKVIEKALGPAEFSLKNIEKLEQFSSPEVVEEFLFLPYQILAEVKKKKVITKDDATKIMAAVAIELLLTTMVRRKNLADPPDETLLAGDANERRRVENRDQPERGEEQAAAALCDVEINHWPASILHQEVQATSDDQAHGVAVSVRHHRTKASRENGKSRQQDDPPMPGPRCQRAPVPSHRHDALPRCPSR